MNRAGRVLLVVLVSGLAAVAGPGAAHAAPPGCAPVSIVAVPGSGETDAQADPAVSRGLLRGLTDPLAARHGARLQVAYLAYPASIDRPVPYPISELRGVEALDRVSGDLLARCPSTRLLLIGFSQGADVVSDVVHRAQRGTTRIAPEAVAGAVMLGSPRRDPDAPNLVEAPGRGILGPRPTRELEVYGDRVVEVCAPTDPVCAADSFDVAALREALASGAHRSYPTLPVGDDARPLYDVLGAAVDAMVAGTGGPGPGGTGAAP